MACLRDLSSLKVLDSNRTCPARWLINSGQLASAMEAEAYEGVFVRLVSTSVTGGKARNGRFTVSDGSGHCGIVLQSFGGKASAPPSAPNMPRSQAWSLSATGSICSIPCLPAACGSSNPFQCRTGNGKDQIHL